MTRTKLKALPESFRKRVDGSGGSNTHWPWTGRLDRGRPFWRDGNKTRNAQIVAFQAAGGVVPKNQTVRPTCGVTTCCNPQHLAAVPPVRRQKLSEDDVREVLRLRAEGVSLSKIAARKGVHFTTVSKIGSRTRRQGVTA